MIRIISNWDVMQPVEEDFHRYRSTQLLYECWHTIHLQITFLNMFELTKVLVLNVQSILFKEWMISLEKNIWDGQVTLIFISYLRWVRCEAFPSCLEALIVCIGSIKTVSLHEKINLYKMIIEHQQSCSKQLHRKIFEFGIHLLVSRYLIMI